MTRTSVEELAEALRPRYAKARRSEKSKILDEFVAVAGVHRKAAIRRLRHARRRSGKRRGRPRVYTPDIARVRREAVARPSREPCCVLGFPFA
ncbi:MAG: hypothetical protein PHU43_04670, partial [Candidatus Bipolaricaulis sp.]|nr:hypothetical protein [Candidatus Bipolaricaulis sp.]